MNNLSVLATFKGYGLSDTISALRSREITYNILTLLSELGVDYTVANNLYFKKEVKNIKSIKLSKNRIVFLYKMLTNVKKLLEDKKISLIHHIHLSYYEFDVLSLFGLTKDYPFVVGPAQAPHMISEDDYALGKRSNRKSIKAEYHAVRVLRKIVSPIINYAFERTLEDCDTLIVVNEKTKKIYSNIVSNKKIEVIPLGVFIDEFQFSPPPLNHEILTTGAHLKRKGFEYLITAMPSILKEYPDARLHILSDGPRREHLEGLTRDLGLKSNVIFHGYLSVNELLSFYKNCRIFCHPSLSEGFCHTTLEAMASGRPVVSTDTNGSEMVEHNKTGFVVPTGDSEAISDAILRILNNDDLTYKMGINARSKVEKEYDWHKLAKKYYEIYCKLCG